MFRALLGDYDGLYDPTDFNDRLLLGLKGIMSEAELRELASAPHADLGAHGWSHRALGALTVQEQSVEIQTSVRRLTEITGTAPSLFAYPPVKPD